MSKWRIENSWGKDSGHDGYITMTSDWFKEWVFEIVVDKSYCPKEVLDAFQTPKHEALSCGGKLLAIRKVKRRNAVLA